MFTVLSQQDYERYVKSILKKQEASFNSYVRFKRKNKSALISGNTNKKIEELIAKAERAKKYGISKGIKYPNMNPFLRAVDRVTISSDLLFKIKFVEEVDNKRLIVKQYFSAKDKLKEIIEEYVCLYGIKFKGDSHIDDNITFRDDNFLVYKLGKSNKGYILENFDPSTIEVFQKPSSSNSLYSNLDPSKDLHLITK